jgi:hypothetical protein
MPVTTTLSTIWVNQSDTLGWPSSAEPCSADAPAYFDHHTSNGTTEAVNGRLEALRPNTVSFRNLIHPDSPREFLQCNAALSF